MRHGFMLWLPIITTFLVPWGTAEPPDTAPARGLLLVVNKMEHTLGIVDPEAGRQLAAVPTGVNGHEVAASPDGRLAYVPIYGNSFVGVPVSHARLSQDRGLKAMLRKCSSSPSARSTFTAFGLCWIPAPTRANLLACS